MIMSRGKDKKMGCCDWCQEVSACLIPVVNRNPTIISEYEFVCEVCAEVERFEHADELLWNPVDFVSLAKGRLTDSWQLAA
jgi:hypothetical protein